MKTTIAITLALFGSFYSLFGQGTTYDSKFNITMFHVNRNIPAELFIKDSIGNLFTGTLKEVDQDPRQIFGWYVEKKSEGAGWNYNTEGIAFYVDLKNGFQNQQLFKGLFNFDKSSICGEYFYFGNEFNFYGTREIVLSGDNSIPNLNHIKIYPNPVDNYLKIDLGERAANCKVYDMGGKLVLEKVVSMQLDVSILMSGSYILEVMNDNNDIDRIKFIKR